jgi:branched-chain amino acid transport system substrate-binding protein
MTMKRRRRAAHRRAFCAAIVGLVILPLAACGSRQSHATLEKALEPTGLVTNTSPGTTSGQSSSGGGSSSPSGTASSGGSSSAGGTSSVGGTGGTGGSGGSSSLGGGGSGSSVTGTTGGSKAGKKSGAGASKSKTKTGKSGSTKTAANALVPGVQSCQKQLAPVVIGSVGEQSGLAGAAVAAGAQTVAAWAAYVNSLGGLRCHPIKFISADDGADPSRNASLTEQLVQSDGVVAFVYNDAPLAAQGSEAYLVQHGIPIIGDEGAEQFMYQHPTFFPQASGGSQLVYSEFAGVAPQLTATQRQHVGVISCLEAAECSISGKLAPQDAPKVGMKLVYNASASLTAPDYTSQCLKAKQSGVQVLFLILDPNSIHRAGSNCRAAGYQGLFATGSTVVIADEATDPNLNHMVFASPTKPWIDTSDPQVGLMNQVLSKYAPGTSPVGSAGLGWASGQLFAASSVYWPNANQITSRDIVSAMDRVRHDDLRGYTTPMTFTRGRDAPPTTCWFEMAVRDGKFVTPNGGVRQCR